MSPVYLELSVPPKVSSPFVLLSVVVGSKETARTSVSMVPWDKRLSVTACRFVRNDPVSGRHWQEQTCGDGLARAADSASGESNRANARVSSVY